jgi:hypothetical protein
LRQPIEHHEGVVRPPAERLRAREDDHQRRILGWTGLQRAPGEIVKRFVLSPVGGRQRHRAAFVPLTAAGIAMGLQADRKKPGKYHGDHVAFKPSVSAYTPADVGCRGTASLSDLQIPAR